MAVKTIDPTLRYTLTNLPSIHVVQKAFIDFPNNQIYALQLYGTRPTKMQCYLAPLLRDQQLILLELKR